MNLSVALRSKADVVKVRLLDRAILYVEVVTLVSATSFYDSLMQ